MTRKLLFSDAHSRLHRYFLKHHLLLALIVFSFAFSPLFFFKFHMFTMMPGDLGDPRCNHYFLENIYQYIIGNSPSLINPRFFYPFPDLLGLNENLFGSSPVYLLARVLTQQADTAYQLWFYFGYLFNYFAAYFALRWLNISVVGSLVGALIFTFSFPVHGQIGHTQLHYRPGVPLAIASFVLFLEQKQYRHLINAFGWLVYQIYCSLYIGLFLLVFLATIAFICFLVLRFSNKKYIAKKIQKFESFPENFSTFYYELKKSWRLLKNKNLLILAFCIFVFFMLGLMIPYIKATLLYNANRPFFSAYPYLPRLSSYFIADDSLIWQYISKYISSPSRGEHQLFIGLIPFALFSLGWVYRKHDKNLFNSTFIGFTLIVLFLLSLGLFNGVFSLWYFVAKFPIFANLRGVSRIILVFLFPIAFFCALGVEQINTRFHKYSYILLPSIILLLILESSFISLPVSSKISWQEHITQTEQKLPSTLKKDAILFFAQTGTFPITDIDAVWVALNTHFPTLNGYGAFFPPYINFDTYGKDCSEVPRRIIAYLIFSKQTENTKLYQALMNRIVPIGFENCEPSWWTTIPKYNIIDNNDGCATSYQRLKNYFGNQETKTYAFLVNLTQKLGIQCPKKLFLNIQQN